MAASKKKKTSKPSNWFNTGPKKLLVFLIAFVVIGGGVMAYRSFAASCTSSRTSKPDKVSNNIIADGSGSCIGMNPSKYDRICVYVSLQKKVGTGSWISSSNDTKCNRSGTSEVDSVSTNTKASVPSQCTTFRTYAKSWIDNGNGTNERKVSTKTSKDFSVNC